MNLHENRSAFEELVTAAAEELNVDERIVEKDYYVTILLKQLKQRLPDMVFKGGTSLSKCYGNIINRFSEDIDISYSAEAGKPGEAKKRKLKTAVTEAYKELGLEIYNMEETRSRRDYNCYRAAYASIYTPLLSIRNELIVETYIGLLPYPTEMRTVNNYIYQFLQSQKEHELIALYHLHPFEIMTQDVRRTLIDKVFALCDYYLMEKTSNHSRHLYDIYKLLSIISFDAELHDLVTQVRSSRKGLSICPSADDEIDINNLLQKMIDQKIYEQDYREITTKLIFEELSYEQAIQGIISIIQSEIFMK